MEKEQKKSFLEEVKKAILKETETNACFVDNIKVEATFTSKSFPVAKKTVTYTFMD